MNYQEDTLKRDSNNFHKKQDNGLYSFVLKSFIIK